MRAAHDSQIAKQPNSTGGTFTHVEVSFAGAGRIRSSDLGNSIRTNHSPFRSTVTMTLCAPQEAT